MWGWCSGGRGTLLSSELRGRDRQGCRGHKRDTEGTGGEAQSTSGWRHREVAGTPKERPGLGQTRSGTQIHIEVPRDPTAHTCRDARRDTRGSPLHTHHTLPDLPSPIPREMGTIQGPGGRLGTTYLSGLESPTCPIWDLPAFSSPLPQDCLKTGRQMVPGGLRWQEQGSAVS